jgi:O-antigen/teichoic acid export membrane protein
MFYPAFVLLVYYAQQIITTLFTNSYVPAVPIFALFAFFLLRRCFNTDVLLRTTGRTGFMLWGTIGSLTLNILLIVLLSRWLGLIGPAVAFLASELALEIYYAQQARRALQLSVSKLADWNSIARIAVSCVLAFPILVGFSLLPGPALLRTVLASPLYFSAVLLLAYRFGVVDVGRIARYVWSRVLRRS